MWLPLALALLAACWAAFAGEGAGPAPLDGPAWRAAVQRAAIRLATDLRAAASTELGAALPPGHSDLASAPVPPVVSPAPPVVSPAPGEQLDGIADKLRSKLGAATGLLLELRRTTVERPDTPSYTRPCPLDSMGRRARGDRPDAPDARSARFREVEVRRRYFLSDADFATDDDCTAAPRSDDDLRRLYHRMVHPDPKLIVFVLDDGSKPCTHTATISILKKVFSILQPSDKIMFRTTSDEHFFSFEDACSSTATVIANATENNKALLLEHLFHIKPSKSPVNYDSLHLQIESKLPEHNAPKEILLMILTDNSILEGPGYFVKAQVNVYTAVGIIDETASDNITKIQHEKLSSQVENFYVPRNFNPGQVATAMLSILPKKYKETVSVGTPYWEPTRRDFMVPLLLHAHGGVLGLDLYWTDLSEDIIYFKRTVTKQRAFIMDMSGTVLMHSFFPRPELSVEKIKFTDFEFVENYNFVFEVKHQILTKSIGHHTVSINNSSSLTYTWRWVRELFIVCIVTEQGEMWDVNATDNFYAMRTSREILYHRLDLFPPKNGNVCRHFKQIATVDQGTVYLSPSSFQSPFSYLQDMSGGQDAAVAYMQNYLAYLKGVAFRFLSNPGLKHDIRSDVGLLNSILTYLKRQHMHGPYSKYIIRRYAVSESGVLVMFPGTVLEYDYEPVRRPWYTSAVENLGKIILSPPNLDVGGAGYVVTISYALQSRNYPFMVVSMDVTMGFLYKMLLDSFPHCTLPYVKCFIMNDRGYLISHPGLMDPSSSGPVEQQHITRMESLIAIDMLNHKGFVTKRLCNNFSDRTIQRFYEFNTSLPNVLSKVVSGDHCIHYYIAAIPATNAFIGVVNASCNLGAFCPCSMVDRLCLNCNRMEQNECECPCECSSNVDSCPVNTVPTNDITDIPLCGAVPENNHHKSHYFYNFAESLKPCFDFQCETYMSYSSCLGVMGCEWCQMDTDTETPLPTPFCTSQSTCFSGVLGAVTPYGEGTLGQVTREDVLGSYSAIGPIAGCIVTVCLIVAIAIYCYKQNVSTASCHDLYVDGPAETWPDQDLQLSHLPSDDHHDHSGQDKLLPANEAEAPISPYKILTGYKRPNTTGDSDHGYSTMTPHEDSEAMAFSMTEPIVMLDDTNLSDISCSVSMKQPGKVRHRPVDMSVTVLPCGKNSIIAPVTVHRHMEAS